MSDCSQPENRSEVCDNVTISTDSLEQSTNVHITVIDVDDNPPVFTQHQMSYGMRRTVKPESLLNLQLRVCLERCSQIKSLDTYRICAKVFLKRPD